MTMAAASVALATLLLHGHAQHLHIYGLATGRPVIIASGDGGWVHLAPHVAEQLAERGWLVTGFDAKAYLSGGGSGGAPLNVGDVQRDFGMLIELAGEAGRKPLLVGVSEGAGLSILAASNPKIRDRISGVVALGLGDPNELRWRWRDSIIYLTKGVPSEPIFHAADFIPQVSPAPLALVWSAHDEFVPASEQHRLVALARAPTRAWMVEASDHRFSDNLSAFDTKLVEVIEWISRFDDR